MPALGLAPVGAAKTLVKHFRCYRLATNHVMLIFLKSGKNSCRLPTLEQPAGVNYSSTRYFYRTSSRKRDATLDKIEPYMPSIIFYHSPMHANLFPLAQPRNCLTA